MLAVVAIIGRPNVGKSTLFNSLLGQKVSITEDSPGVTRDRLYRPIEWQNRQFLLMDTGGLEPDSNEIMACQIESQVDLALEDADLILFMVDGREGLNSLDRMVAEKIHKSGKKCIMVVNKIDSHVIPAHVYEFYELGFEDMIVISAEQKLSLGDLLDEIFERLPAEKTSMDQDEGLKICLIGKPNVGKSSMVNRFLGEDRMIVTDIPGTTRDSIDSVFIRDDRKYTLIDTAGLRRQRAVDNKIERYSVLRTLSSVDRSDLCLFLIDAKEGPTEQDAKISGYAHDKKKASIIVVNKWDLVEKDTNTQKQLEEKIRNILSFNHYAPIITVSVKSGQRLEKLLDLIERVDANYRYRIATGLLNQIIRDAQLMNPPATDKGRRLKIYYATQVTTGPPKILLYVNDPEMMHFSYLRYLENQIRKNFDFTGVPLTLELRERKD